MKINAILTLIILFMNCGGKHLFAQSGKTPARGKQGFDLPIVDLDQQTQLQVIVDKEEGQYLGHPSTVLLDDGKTMIVVYPKGHGKGALIMKKSPDGGKTWSNRLPTPKSWDTSQEVPILYPTKDSIGQKRIILFSGTQDYVESAVRMAWSADDGVTWSELEPIGDYNGVVAMSDCIPLKEPGRYLATFHTRGPREANSMILYQVFSEDGGVTWGTPQKLNEDSRSHLCEAGLIYSPDKKEIAMLLRENARNYNSQIMFSKDEGKTWSNPLPMPGALCGDRHQGIYLPDGRLLIQFRDNNPTNRPGNYLSPTEGDWVGWVGTYDDLKNGHEGEYRIRFRDNKKHKDTAYPAAELLPDGTLVCTSYGHWEKDEPPYIISFRFKIETLDSKARDIRKNGQPKVINDMTGIE